MSWVSEVTGLIRWIITFALDGNIIHFLGTWMIVGAIGRLTDLVRINRHSTTNNKGSD